MNETMLQAQQVRKAYRRHQVLRGVDLEVRPGQLVAVVGENGAGSAAFAAAGLVIFWIRTRTRVHAG
jgi:ABC-type sugar transport system ATPase subunit